MQECGMSPSVFFYLLGLAMIAATLFLLQTVELDTDNPRKNTFGYLGIISCVLCTSWFFDRFVYPPPSVFDLDINRNYNAIVACGGVVFWLIVNSTVPGHRLVGKSSPFWRKIGDDVAWAHNPDLNERVSGDLLRFGRISDDMLNGRYVPGEDVAWFRSLVVK